MRTHADNIQEYIKACRRQIDAQIATYRSLVTAGADLPGSGRTQFDSAIRAFEPVFFSNLVLVLENYFVHRSRTIEGKDGNPLNEVRILCTSMMSNNGRLAADKSIRLDPATSVGRSYRTVPYSIGSSTNTGIWRSVFV